MMVGDLVWVAGHGSAVHAVDVHGERVLVPDVQARLTALREQTNPRQLLAQIEAQLDYLFSLPCRTPDHTEVVYDTLSEIPDPRPETEPVR
jgi:dienelactone hydrolase